MGINYFRVVNQKMHQMWLIPMWNDQPNLRVVYQHLDQPSPTGIPAKDFAGWDATLDVQNLEEPSANSVTRWLMIIGSHHPPTKGGSPSVPNDHLQQANHRFSERKISIYIYIKGRVHTICTYMHIISFTYLYIYISYHLHIYIHIYVYINIISFT